MPSLTDLLAVRKRPAVEPPLEGVPSSSKSIRILSAIVPDRTPSFSSQFALDSMSIALVSTSTFPRMFHDAYSGDPVLMQLSFLEEFENHHHKDFLRRIEEVRRVQIAQLERFKQDSDSRRK